VNVDAVPVCARAGDEVTRSNNESLRSGVAATVTSVRGGIEQAAFVAELAKARSTVLVPTSSTREHAVAPDSAAWTG
jgi:hypothetical protein